MSGPVPQQEELSATAVSAKLSKTLCVEYLISFTEFSLRRHTRGGFRGRGAAQMVNDGNLSVEGYALRSNHVFHLGLFELRVVSAPFPIGIAGVVDDLVACQS